MFDLIFKTFFDKKSNATENINATKSISRAVCSSEDETCLSKYFERRKGLNLKERERFNRSVFSLSCRK